MSKNIMEILDKKIQEHKTEVQSADAESTDLREVFNKLTTTGEKTKALTHLQRMMILKDKIVFHKACIAVLGDLKEELKDVG